MRLFYTLMTSFLLCLSYTSARANDLTESQRLIGAYNTDDIASSGMGFPGYDLGTVRVGNVLTPDKWQEYKGGKIIAIRYADMHPGKVSKLFFAPVKSNGSTGSDLFSVNVSGAVQGWNTVTLPTPITLPTDGKSYMLGLEYTQDETMEGGDYTDACKPLSLISSGNTLRMYGNLKADYGGTGLGWYDFGYYDVSVQLIVQLTTGGAKALKPADFGIVSALKGNSGTLNLTVTNTGTKSLKSFSYITTIDGTAQPETTLTLDDSLQAAASTTCNIPLPAFDEPGKRNMTVEVTKVDGTDNTWNEKTAQGYYATVAQYYDRNVLIEEFTTEHCTNCPAMAKALAQALADLKSDRLNVVAHHSGYDTDWLTQPCDDDMLWLFVTDKISAPNLMIDRQPYFTNDEGNDDNIFHPNNSNEIKQVLNYELVQPTNARLQLTLTPNADTTQVVATVSGTCNEAFDTDNQRLTFYLTEESIKAHNQSGADENYIQNHVIRYYNSTWGDDITWTGNTFEKTFNISLNSDWKKKDLTAVAIINRYDGKDKLNSTISNAAFATLPPAATAIKQLSQQTSHAIAGIYDVAGNRVQNVQKGLNIIRYTDGTAKKVIIK